VGHDAVLQPWLPPAPSHTRPFDLDTNVSVDDGWMTTSIRPLEHPKTVDRLRPGDALVIGLLMASTFLVLLNEMLLGVALPTLITELGITPSAGQWLTTGYLLTLAVLIPATGRRGRPVRRGAADGVHW
jgi:hypothetical protein